MKRANFWSGRARLRVVHRDETSFGSALTEICDENIRRAFDPIREHRRRFGMADCVKNASSLLANVWSSGAVDRFFARKSVLADEFLYPDPDRVRATGLEVIGPKNVLLAEIELPPSLVSELARWIGDWSRGSPPPADRNARALFDALIELGVLGDEARPVVPLDGALLIGHATFQLGSPGENLLFDPFLFPRGPRYPETLQPHDAGDLEPPSAILITHSHPDHFDPGSLLPFGADVPIVVPKVERENVLSTDLETRLRQLGFTDVRSLGWFEELTLSSFRVLALPFYGEQPTTGARLHPEIRNQGNVYCVEAGGRRVAVTVDSGRDIAGDSKALVASIKDRFDAPDLLMGGYRGFALYPIHYLFSSISRYLLFVPPESWAVRQKMMNDADDLIDLAEIWGARSVVPYADGGAPWHWEMGLGPRLDGKAQLVPAVDPTPEHVLSVARARSGSSSEGLISTPVDVALLRPGDSIRWENDLARVVRAGEWPYSIRG